MPAFDNNWLRMRIAEQQRKTVVFFGYPDSTPGKGGINCIGTGFLFEYDQVGYLVTAKHLSHGLGRDPFLIRVNQKDGSSQNLHADDVRWFEHPDPAVDLSAVPLHLPIESHDVSYVGSRGHLLTREAIEDESIGVGNLTYTIGLFRLLSGEKRNLPICHFGSVALMPGDEKIPVKDWTDLHYKRTIFVDGYLVESQSLSGLSGSPVFVRTEENLNLMPLLSFTEEGQRRRRPTDNPDVQVPRAQLRLLGVWQGAWEAPPDEVLAAQSGNGVRVPVGMGIVVPCYRLAELMEMPEVKRHRDDSKAHWK